MVELHAAAPLAAKVRRSVEGPEVMIVGSAASLLEGDELRIELTLAEGARLTVTSVAAQLAHPCPGGGRTSVHVRADLAPGSQLDWRPEPTVVCAGGRHRARVEVVLAEGAEACWLDEVVLGRTGESPTNLRVASEMHVDGPGGPLLRDGLDTGAPGAHGPAVLGPSVRFVGARHAWGRRAPAGAAGSVVRFELAGEGTMWRVATADVAAGRAALAGVSGQGWRRPP